MNLSSFIALRYFRSEKSHSVINLISWVAVIAIMVPTAALVIILSLHNGLSATVEGLYNSFDSQIRITPLQGKFFDPSTLDLTHTSGVSDWSFVIEDNVLLRNGEREHLATMRGVDSSFSRVVPIEGLMTHGTYDLTLGDLRQTVVGQGIAYDLGINPSLIQQIDIYAILPDRGNSIFPTPIYRNQSITPVGVYTLDQQSDSRYLFVPLDFAQELLGFEGRVSSAELLLTNGVNANSIKQELEASIGDQFRIETRYEQKASLYRAFNQEKWIIYLLLMMVLLIASLSLAGSIVMVIADKRPHISTLRTMGATTHLIRSIFRYEGMLIVAIGSITGIIIGALFSLLQEHFGFIKMAGETMITDTYPVRLIATDLVVVAAGVWFVGWSISMIAVRYTIKNSL